MGLPARIAPTAARAVYGGHSATSASGREVSPSRMPVASARASAIVPCIFQLPMMSGARMVYDRSVRASTPGSARPSRNSRKVRRPSRCSRSGASIPARRTAATGIPASDHREGRGGGHCSRHPERPFRKGGPLEHPQGAVPDDRASGLQGIREAFQVRGPMSSPMWSAGIWRTLTARPWAVYALCHHGVDRQHHRHAAASRRLERHPRHSPCPARGASAPVVTERTEKRVRHSAADEEDVDLPEQILDERELVGNLSPSEHAATGARGTQDPPERRRAPPP